MTQTITPEISYYQQLSQLRCFLLPAKIEYCRPDFISHHNCIYDFWHNLIHAALCEEKNFQVANELGSESFLENDEVVALFDDNHPVGLFMFRWINTEFKINRELNALRKRFPKTLLDSLIEKKYSRIMLMGHIAVHPQWRKSTVGFGVSDMLVSFALSRFLESTADVLLTTTRNNRRTNDLCYVRGAKKFAGNGKVFGVESDITIFQRDDVTPMQNEAVRIITQQAWERKKTGWIDMPLSFLENREK